MSFTKPDLKKLAKYGNASRVTVKLLANEVLTYKEINAELRKDGRRAAECMEQLESQLEQAREVIAILEANLTLCVDSNGERDKQWFIEQRKIVYDFLKQFEGE